MKPFQYKIVGYIADEPGDFYHGRWLGNRPTLLLRVHYPMPKEDWKLIGDEPKTEEKRTRCFPFVIHPNYMNELKSKGPMRGQIVIATFYLDTVERGKTIRVMPVLTRVENIIEDFPHSTLNKESIWIDANSIEEGFDYGKI